MSMEDRLIFLCTMYLCLMVGPVRALPVSQFYPFGSAAGDQQLPKNDDGSSGRIQISIPFPFFDRNHDSLFVNTNGVISFLVQVSQFTPAPFPLGQDKRFLAPFWADVDITNGGDVWYRETTNQQLLERTTDEVRKAFITQKKFAATWVYIATWEKVAFYGAIGVNKNRRNTFQAVLITNGRHSFVTYNYDTVVWTTGTSSGGDSSGLGGIPAQCGFNAGDGIRFFTIPGSRTNNVLQLPTTSNVAKPGVWMFRIDNANIEAGGCNTKGSLTVFPNFASMLGGDNIYVAGPCYKPTDIITCEFAGKARTNGTYMDGIRAVCTVPLMNNTGRVSIKVSRDGGNTFPFHGIFTYVTISRIIPRVSRYSPDTWVEGHNMRMEWEQNYLGNKEHNVSVQVARYVMDNDVVLLHSFYTVVQTQKNSGTSSFTVPSNEGVGKRANRFITIMRVIKRPLYASQSQSSYEWIWSDVFTWLGSHPVSSL